jgi:DNA-binding LacI/PurR family transcriptional regulator
LTTVRQDVVEKGTRAASELVAAVRGRRAGDEPPVRHHVLPTELVVRGTTAPPGGGHATKGTFVG